MTEIGDARAGNEPDISGADHSNAHRFCSSAGHCRAPATAPISAPTWPTMHKCYASRLKCGGQRLSSCPTGRSSAFPLGGHVVERALRRDRQGGARGRSGRQGVPSRARL